ncbi:MAG: M3 family oligoendopeptidase [Bacilli bacterium]|nr:M3 family oligoendopeptidase [Bacilli bacterium]
MKELDLKFEQYELNVPTEKRTLNKLEKLVNELEECGSFLTAKTAIKHYNKYMSQLTTDMSVISVRYSLNTEDKVYKKAQEKVDEISPLISNYSTKFEKILVKAKYRKDLENAYGKYLLKMYEGNLKSFDEKIIPELIEENKLSSKYDEITGGAQIKFKDGTYNLSQMGKFLCDADRETRRGAAIALDGWWKEHEQEIGDIYDKLVKLRDKMAKKLGFKNFIELGYLRLGRTDYDAKMVKGYRDQIKEEVVPICQKLYKQQMKNLGIKNPQYYDYNLKFASGNPTPKGNAQDLVKAAKKMYESLSKESGEFFNFMIKHNLMDLEARKGKQPGGYCTYFPVYKAPFIFSNFNGTDGDVNVLTHEGGHALQAYLSSDIKIPEYQSPTLEACEIHSMSMEFFAWPYMKDFFGADAEKYKYAHLVDAIEFLPYGITIDEFQHWVYEHPEATHQERCAKYLEIEQANLPHKKYDECEVFAHGGWWMKQSHIFGVPFYYIDYTLAQVVAFQFLAEDRKSHDKAWKKYIKLCKLGGKLPFTGLLEKDHLRNPFEPGNVAKNIRPLVKLLKEMDTSKF